MIKIKRTSSKDNNFIELVEKLDKDLAIRDGDDHAFYAQYNKIDMINHVIVAYDDDTPIGCGAMKPYSESTMEIKRMYTNENARSKGVASIILQNLEAWAKELSYNKCILETGIKQPEAIRLYTKNNYQIIPNYGQYKNAADSRCFEKKL